MPHILLVEDSATQAEQIASTLEQHGCEVARAENGIQALASIESQRPDLVVTDMRMPEMDGLELVRRIHSEHPTLPTVMTTAHGSEELAIDALATGAASYLSKRHIILLPELTHRIIRLSVANSASLFLKGSLARSNYRFVLDCSPKRIDPLICLIVRMLTAMGVAHTCQRIRIGVALDCVLYQSMIHGNLEEPVGEAPLSRKQAEALVKSKQGNEQTREMTDRIVGCKLEVTDDRVIIVVEHQGKGNAFQHAAVPGTPESFESERGRGLLLLTSIMDEVMLSRRGHTVTMVKHF